MKLEKRIEKPNQARSKGLTPGVIYGKSIESTPIKVDEKELLEKFKEYERSTVFEVKLDNKKHKVYFKDIEQNPLSPGKITHFSLLKVSATDTISASVPINVVNRDEIEKQDLLIQMIENEIEIEFNPGKGVTEIDVDVSGMEVGDSIEVKDLKVPKDVKIVTEEDRMVLNIAHPELEKDTTPDTEMEEPEVVGEDKESEEESEEETKEGGAKESKKEDSE